MKKPVFLLTAIFSSLFLLSPLALAEDTSDRNSVVIGESRGDYADEIKALQDQIAEVEDDLAATQEKQRTLKNEIAYMENQIYLTTLEIQETETRIKAKESELEELQGDIEGLEERIQHLSELLVEQQEILRARARENYKSSRLNGFEILFGASTISRLVDRLKYLRVLELQDQRLIEQMKSTRQDCSEQKELLEMKKVEIENLKTDIEAYKATLETRRAELVDHRKKKEILLAETRNSEQEYQELLRESQAQLAAIRALLSVRGSSDLLSDQTKCGEWGCYYNQRDKEWGTYRLGESELSVANYGCLVTSVAMLATYNGYNMTPKDVAIETAPFFGNTAYLLFGSSAHPLEVGGFAFHREILSYGSARLDDYLEGGPVIAGLYSGPAHFIVIKEKVDGEYIINDPWYADANGVPLTDYYSVGDISRIDRVIFY